MDSPKNDRDASPVTGDAAAIMTLTFCKKLKDLRESRGISRSALAQLTRINVTFIEALEEGAFDQLPGHAFARGFIRNLCSAMNQPYEDMLAAYEACFKTSGTKLVAVKPEAKAKSVRRVSVSFGNPRFMTRLKKVRPEMIMAVVAVVALGIILPQWLQNAQTVPSSSVASSVATKVESSSKPTTVPEIQPVAAILQPAQVVVPDAGTVTAPAVVGKDIAPTEIAKSTKTAALKVTQTIEIDVKDPVKVKMTMDNGEAKVREFKPDVYRFTFADVADLVVYDAAALSVSFNGRPLGELGAAGRVRRLSFRAAETSDSL